MQDETVVAQLHERQPPQAIERVLRGSVGQHGGQEGERRAPDDRGRIECQAGHRVENGEVELRQLRHDRLDGDGFDADVGSLGQRGSGESQRQRVAASEQIDAPGVRTVDAGPQQQRFGVLTRETPQREAAEQRAQHARPCHQRRFATRDHDPDVGVEGRNERLSNPRVEDAEDFVGVQDENDALTQAAQPDGGILERRYLGAGRAAEGAEEAALRGLDGSAVQPQDGCAAGPGLDREGLGER